MQAMRTAAASAGGGGCGFKLSADAKVGKNNETRGERLQTDDTVGKVSRGVETRRNEDCGSTEAMSEIRSERRRFFFPPVSSDGRMEAA